jgi:sulfide:quinone oxidoreductase
VVSRREVSGGADSARAGAHDTAVMTGSSDPRRPFRVIVAGGGVAGLETVLGLQELATGLVDVELIAPEHHFWYRPLAVAEPFDAGRVARFELAVLATEAGATFTPGEVVAVEAREREVVLRRGGRRPYDMLVLALGSVPEPALSGALTFRGPADSDAFRRLREEVLSAEKGDLVFALPSGASWPLPLYELALMSAAELRTAGSAVRVALVTHEAEPLAIFGGEASAAVAALLAERGISVHLGRHASAAVEGSLLAVPGERIPADWVVAMPRLHGPRLVGVPTRANGFVPTDPHGRVPGLPGVFAAGDLTDFPVKQGGLAAQQADAVVEAIAADAGARVEPTPFEPVLRGLLLTGGVPAYLRAELAGGKGETSLAAGEALWWPPGKIVGRFLAPFLARTAGVEPYAPLEQAGVVAVNVPLERERTAPGADGPPSSEALRPSASGR